MAAASSSWIRAVRLGNTAICCEAAPSLRAQAAMANALTRRPVALRDWSCASSWSATGLLSAATQTILDWLWFAEHADDICKCCFPN
jgi:hypothetical protein